MVLSINKKSALKYFEVRERNNRFFFQFLKKYLFISQNPFCFIQTNSPHVQNTSETTNVWIFLSSSQSKQNAFLLEVFSFGKRKKMAYPTWPLVRVWLEFYFWFKTHAHQCLSSFIFYRTWRVFFFIIHPWFSTSYDPFELI